MQKIGLEATRANRIYRTGTEWYAWHLLQQFRKISGPIQFIVYYNQKLTEDLSWQQDNFYFKRLSWPFKKLWTHLRLGLELFLHPVDIFFATNTVPILARGRLAVTIHDLGFLKNPELYHPLEKIFHKISHWIYFHKADKIIAISETTKQDIIRYYPRTKNKIKVIYSGYDSQSFKVISSHEQEAFKDLHEFPDKYILYVGRIETKKNIQNLIRAYKKLNTDWPLILAGRPGNFGFDEIQSMVQDPEVKDKIILLGYVSQRNYPLLLGSASLFVFPSRFEGFGLPVIEAMACGIPVAASSLPVIKEIAGESVHYFDPQNIDDMAEKIQELIDNQALQEKLIKRGLEKVVDYSWSKCARQTVDFLLDKNNLANIVKASGPAIIKDGKLLLIKKLKFDRYEFPGGTVKEGEDLKQTALREVKEEIGCEVELEGQDIVICFTENGRLFEGHHFLAKIKSGIPQILEPEVSSELLWLPIQDYKKYKLAPNAVEFCKKVVDKSIKI